LTGTFSNEPFPSSSLFTPNWRIRVSSGNPKDQNWRRNTIKHSNCTKIQEALGNLSMKVSPSSTYNSRHTCRSCPCFSDYKRHRLCGKRCNILTSIMTKNPIRRLASAKVLAWLEAVITLSGLMMLCMTGWGLWLLLWCWRMRVMVMILKSCWRLGKKEKLRNKVLDC